MSKIKSCPFATLYASASDRRCMGEECINFRWSHKIDGAGNISQSGRCMFFNSLTGHERIT